jgi:hypothetical protein
MFTVHAISSDFDGIGTELASSRYYKTAKRIAEQKAMEYHYGTVVVDTSRGIADWGDEWTRVNNTSEKVAPPRYAR